MELLTVVVAPAFATFLVDLLSKQVVRNHLPDAMRKVQDAVDAFVSVKFSRSFV